MSKHYTVTELTSELTKQILNIKTLQAKSLLDDIIDDSVIP